MTESGDQEIGWGHNKACKCGRDIARVKNHTHNLQESCSCAALSCINPSRYEDSHAWAVWFEKGWKVGPKLRALVEDKLKIAGIEPTNEKILEIAMKATER